MTRQRTIVTAIGVSLLVIATPAAAIGPVVVEPDDDAHCEGGCIAVSGTGESSGWIAVSAADDADGSQAAASGTGDADALWAASVAGDRSNGTVAVAGTGYATGRLLATSLTGDADALATGVTLTGDSEGWISASGTGDAECNEDRPHPIHCIQISP